MAYVMECFYFLSAHNRLLGICMPLTIICSHYVHTISIQQHHFVLHCKPHSPLCIILECSHRTLM